VHGRLGSQFNLLTSNTGGKLDSLNARCRHIKHAQIRDHSMDNAGASAAGSSLELALFRADHRLCGQDPK